MIASPSFRPSVVSTFSSRSDPKMRIKSSSKDKKNDDFVLYWHETLASKGTVPDGAGAICPDCYEEEWGKKEVCEKEIDEDDEESKRRGGSHDEEGNVTMRRAWPDEE